LHSGDVSLKNKKIKKNLRTWSCVL